MIFLEVLLRVEVKSMFSKIDIRNFRCFNSLVIDNISPVTIIGGRNNVGKSSILEAVFLVFGYSNPSVFFTLAAFRNGNGILDVTPQKIFGPLFYNFNQKPFQIIMNRDDKRISSLVGTKTPDDTVGLNVNNEVVGNILKHGYNPTNMNEYFYSLSYKYSIDDKEKSGTYSIQNKQIKYNSHSNGIETMNLPMVKVSLYKSVFIPPNTDIAEWVSKLILDGKKELLLEVLRDFNNEIIDVNTVIENSVPYIYISLSDGSKMPITYMGDGINKALQILLCILSSPNGIVLIDEIENGFHYSVYARVLNSFYKAALKVNCQMIITTHNNIIIETSADVMNALGKLESLCYQRIDFSKGVHTAYSFKGRELKDALDLNMEVR